MAFPGGPFDVPDEVGDGKPVLAVLSYDGVAVRAPVERVPDLVARIYSRKGAEGSALRTLRNDLVFVVADDAQKDDMRSRTYRRLALRELKKPERLADLADHQQDAAARARGAVRTRAGHRHPAMLPARLLPVPRPRGRDGGVDLAHTAIDMHSASDKPGAGQRQVVRALRELKKLRLSGDEPDSPSYVRDRTPLKKGSMTTRALRGEFRRDPALPMLIGDDVFVSGVRRGVEQGDYVYRRGALLLGPGDPPASASRSTSRPW